jgi:hypothetical protein
VKSVKSEESEEEMTIYKNVKKENKIFYDEDLIDEKIDREFKEILKNANHPSIDKEKEEEDDDEADEDMPDLEDITDSDEEDNPLDELE